MNGIEHFLTVNWNFLGCDNSQANFVTPDFHYRDGNVVVDDDALVFFPGKY